MSELYFSVSQKVSHRYGMEKSTRSDSQNVGPKRLGNFMNKSLDHNELEKYLIITTP